MQAAVKKVRRPSQCKLKKEHLPFWRSIVKNRAPDSWNDADLEIAANLARCKYDIERVQAQLWEEGDIVRNDRGTPIVNPKHTLLQTLSARSTNLSRFLQVHAEATQGKSRDQVSRNKAAQSARQAIEDHNDDDLIPMATHH